MKIRKNKDGVTTSAGKHTSDRLTKGTPGKKTSPKTKRPPGASKPGRPRRSKDDLTTTISDRGDLKLNIGICGRVLADGTVPGPNRCQPVVPGETRGAVRSLPPGVVRVRARDVTWEQVLAETKSVVFPGLTVKVQPKDRTLVNFENNVYTDDSKVSSTTVTLLGFPVEVQATPISYTWRFGDGTPALTTSTPGKASPGKEIIHKYLKRGNVRLTVTTNYAARYNVAGTGWQYVPGTVPITGPATPLAIHEAIPVLVDPER
ncbi:PKD domain-containing protein [Kribbella solani]|nr:PKD domain-containing protein [Kribbella solani]